MIKTFTYRIEHHLSCNYSSIRYLIRMIDCLVPPTINISPGPSCIKHKLSAKAHIFTCEYFVYFHRFFKPNRAELFLNC